MISWLLRSVSRKPLRWVLAILLEPLLRRGFGVVFGRFAKEKHETTAK
ncbi:phage shock protein D [Yersinia ruckeri]|nr:phage shock protein PspD [Yersinia ruckeri]MCK8560669.1 phage shock protein D [Yersinia ruckeri]MCW6570120.1 phage shock protein D [Yersinia ruckeri]MCW6590594.1 phage shock protein D [Yersinia ruckeri]MCW6672176.1 phage shock protein D [Yersinia ruckeri]UIM99262.1 phage shock protein D [Yersinia ruckeri]